MRHSFRNGWGARGMMTHIVRNQQTGKYDVQLLRLAHATGEPPVPRRPTNAMQHKGRFDGLRHQAPLLNVLLTNQQR